MAFVLSDRAAISLSGAETKGFLQGLITNDVTKLSPATPLYAALLTPQGKVLFDFLLFEREGDVLLDCSVLAAAALLKRLTMYRLRASIAVEIRRDLAVKWEAERFGGALHDPRLPEMGWRAIVGREDASRDGTAHYRAYRLSRGVPEAGDFGSDKIFALDAGLEELRGVSFEKGCYVGQELTARMKHRGTARKRLLPVLAVHGGDLPPVGTDVQAGETSLGEISSTYGTQGFALIRLDRWQEAGQQSLRAADTAVQIANPGWLHSDV